MNGKRFSPLNRLFFLIALIVMAFGFTACSGDQEQVEPPSVLEMSSARMAIGGTGEVTANLKNPPEGLKSVTWTVDLRYDQIESATINPGADLPANGLVFQEEAEEGPPKFRFRVEAPEGEDLKEGSFARISFDAPNWIRSRQLLTMTNVEAILADGTPATLEREPGTIAVSIINDPVIVAAFLAGIVALIYLASQWKAMEKFFRFLPPLIWMYFIPMISTTIGITPDASAFYSPFMSRIMLPAILVLLLIPSDIAGLVRLGGKAVGVMLFATAGIVTGAIASFALFNGLFPESMPEESWKGVAALSGSWIGGSPNMTAVFESVGTPPGILGPIIVVDTVLAYSWLGILIAFAAYQDKVDKYHGADTTAIEEISLSLEQEHKQNARSPRVADITYMLGIALVVSQVCLWLGGPLFTLFDAQLEWKAISEVVSSYGWGILLITAAGLALSLTRVRHLDYCGASSVGYAGLYLLLTTYGARADLRAILETPVFFGMGLLWLAIHICFLYAGVRILRAPLFLGATSSMANIGGTASAPVVAASYNQSMAPIGLLMAILGGTLGTPLALLVVATICRLIAGG